LKLFSTIKIENKYVWKWILKLNLNLFFHQKFDVFYLTLRTYKYILKLHHVENGEYLIIHLFSPTCTSLDNQKKIEKKLVILKKFTWMHIRYVINQHHCDKIKDYPLVNH
jgi:hypothetical protein